MSDTEPDLTIPESPAAADVTITNGEEPGTVQVTNNTDDPIDLTINVAASGEVSAVSRAGSSDEEDRALSVEVNTDDAKRPDWWCESCTGRGLKEGHTCQPCRGTGGLRPTDAEEDPPTPGDFYQPKDGDGMRSVRDSLCLACDGRGQHGRMRCRPCHGTGLRRA